MRNIVRIAIILLLSQCSAVHSKRKYGRKTSDNNSVQTVKYQEHRDVSLLYGASKDAEDSGQTITDDREGSTDSFNRNLKLRRTVKKHHLKGSRGFPKRRVDDLSHPSGMRKNTVATNNNQFKEFQDKEKVAFNIRGSKMYDKKNYAPRKRHKFPRKTIRHKETSTKKRTEVEDDLSEERQTIKKTLDSFDDISGSYNRGVNMDGMDIKEVSMIDNNTLSDYFHALNGNASEGNNNNYMQEYASSPTPASTWEESSPSDTEESSGNDDFYDAIDRGDEPPPLKMKKVRPTKSNFDTLMHKSSKHVGSSPTNPGTGPSSKFRLPSQEDFENFFRGMLDHFGHGRNPDQSVQQSESKVNQHQRLDSQRNISNFLEALGEHRPGNVTKVVSLGSPEEVEVERQSQHPNMVLTSNTGSPLFTNEQVGRDGEGLTPFLPPENLMKWRQGPFGGTRIPLHGREKGPVIKVGNPLTFLRIHPQDSEKHVDHFFPKKQNGALPSNPSYKGTRIMGGKISGGQISGGLIKGGQIKAGSIEGGIIKGGKIVGGRIANGTMEGGVIAKGQMLGGHLVNGRLEGGQLLGGNVFGGRILGGTVEGGEMKGGVVAGGRFRGGRMQGGLLRGGEVQSGILRGGKVEGGILHGGNIEGGEFKFGDISGGTLKSGAMLGGQLKNGSIEGGTLKGGTIEGGILKGGVMEGGHLKGGLVLAGKIKGGVIEGGIIEGGEIGDGVLIRNGKVNATIISTGSTIDKNQELSGIFQQGENPQQLGLKVDQQKFHQSNGKTPHASKAMSDSPTSPQVSASTPEHNLGLTVVNPSTDVKIPIREGTLKMLPQENDQSDDSGLEKLLSEGKSEGDSIVTPELSSQRFFEEQDQPSRAVQKKGSKQHHVVFDGVGFDLPNEDFVDLIDKMKEGPKVVEDLVSYYTKPKRKENLHMGRISEEKNVHIKPEELEARLSSPTKPRSSVTRSDKDKHHDSSNASISKSSDAKGEKIKAVSFNTKDAEKLRPTYHWSLNKLMEDRIPGSPGPAIRTHGEMVAIRGGLHLNGHNAWLGAGDFSGGCISDPDTCDDGLSFEMTFRLDKDALKYNDMNYIVDSGASTFNSKGFTLYTVHGKLRADLALANQEFCVQIPVTVQKWQDVLITWKKSEGMKMYVNCELKAHTKGSEHCIGCHSRGCHVTDTNTLLMIGRPNYSPHFHCTKFDSGDISFWEKYLSANDVETLCGAPTGESEKPSAANRETNQLTVQRAPVNQAFNQVRYPAYPMQSYLTNQPYFNRYPAYTSQILPSQGLAAQSVKLFAFNPATLYAAFHSPKVSSLQRGTEPGLTRALTQDGGYSDWSDWGNCDRTCGGGAQVRTRICNNPLPSGDGKMCHALGPAIQVRRCNRRGCPVDGGYSPWSAFGPCSKTCGSGGIQRRVRTCTNPTPMNGGKPCFGRPLQTRTCNTRSCPVDGGYSMWSPWLPCDADCGGGIQERTRFCDNPHPQIGGRDCSILGSNKETRLCNLFPCNVNGF
ncbi:uncharacterized protein LOC111338320 isoform X2 [Stylophora pistillata]|uniref:uncharacterized protein LOC111338320 isoform X2 n=1 Tax=Stylophora pistillata TaxID=50429 RepID=UPI000C03F13E|nr:uncharacterized protein LOC111338320 isoform X2 [Stylophora pistillata]